MRSGLRLRLTLAVGAIAAAAVLASSLLTERAAGHELSVLRTLEERVDPFGELEREALVREARRAWDEGDLEAVLERALGAREGFALVALTNEGEVRARTSDLRDLDVRLSPRGGLRLEGEGLVLVVDPGERLAVAAADRILGYVYALPLPADHDRAFRGAVRGWALGASLVTSVLAMVLTALYLRRALAPIEALTASVRSVRAGAGPLPVAAPARDEVGELVGAFDELTTELARGEELRRNLTNDVAHELRTPLTNVRCRLEALRDGVVPATAEEVASLHEEVLVLQRLVDDLQMLATAEAGRLTLEREVVDLDAELVRIVGPVAARAEQRVVFEGRPGARRVSVDRTRLHQVLSNLLENALAHTPPDGRIDVTAETAGREALVRVADTGSGIPAADLPHVFERFHRVDPSRSRATGGTGLGLAIVRQLVEAHGGRVEVASRPGEGTTFTLFLPLA